MIDPKAHRTLRSAFPLGVPAQRLSRVLVACCLEQAVRVNARANRGMRNGAYGQEMGSG